MKTKKTKIFNVILFIALIVLTFYVVFKNNDINDILIAIKGVDKKFIFIGIAIMFIFSMCEAINIHSVLHALGNKLHFFKSLKYAIVGFFFSSITPSSSGGQPLQLYFMSKDKISMAHSIVALVVELFSFQVASVVLAIIGLIMNHNLLFNDLGNIKYLIFLGLAINSILLIFLIIVLFSKTLALKVLNIIYAILKKLHIKKATSFYESSLKQLDEYHDSALFLKKHKSILYKTIVISFIQLFLYHSIPYFVYLSFGLNEYFLIDLVSMQSLLYISVSSLPLPGAMGVSEGSFVILFKIFFPVNILSSAMLLSRGISFYSYTILTGIIILLFVIYDKFRYNRVNFKGEKNE